MDSTLSSTKSSVSNITQELLKLAEQPGFDYAFQQFERIRFAAELLVGMSSGTASESESESNTDPNTKPTQSARKRKTPSITIILEESVDSAPAYAPATIDEETDNIVYVKKRQVCETPVYWTGTYDGKIFELIKARLLHVIIPDNIVIPDILSVDTFKNSEAYAEFTVHLCKNLILPIRNSPIYANLGFCSKPLDQHVTMLLDKSIQPGVWTRVETLEQQTTSDGKKYYTYAISDSNIKRYKLQRPRI
jgi:hypothetical protein